MSGACLLVKTWTALLALGLCAMSPSPARGFPMPDDPLTRPERGVNRAAIAQQIQFYGEAADSINSALSAAITRLASAAIDSREAYTASQQQQHLARMQQEIAQAMRGVGGVPSSLDEPTRRAVAAAIAQGEAQLRELGLKPTDRIPGSPIAGPRFGLVDRRAVEVIARDTVAKASSDIAGSMRAALDSQGRAAGDLFRRLSQSVIRDGSSPLRESATNRAIARGLITGNVREANGLLRDIFRDPSATIAESYRKLGNQIIQVGRAEMTVRSYASLVVRTRTREATVAARHERLGASGISLVQITGRTSVNFCTAFIGLVVSLTGEQVSDGVRYPALASLPGGGPPFHPNCTKGTAAYIPDLVSAGRVAGHERSLIEFQTRVRQDRLLAPVRA